MMDPRGTTPPVRFGVVIGHGHTTAAVLTREGVLERKALPDAALEEMSHGYYGHI